MSNSNSVHFDRRRLWVIYALIVIVFGYFAYRLFNLQVINGAQYLARANDNRTSEVSIQAQRGIIYDRNGFVLARNVASYNIVITPANLPGNPTMVIESYRIMYGEPQTTDLGAVEQVYRELSKLIDIPVTNPAVYDNQGFLKDEIVKTFKPCDNPMGITEIVLVGDTNAPYSPVQIKCNVDERRAMIVREHASDWPGVSVEIVPVRDYPTGWLSAEIIGFLGPIPALQEDAYKKLGFVPGRDKVGYSGIEATLQDVLGGKNGSRKVEVDSAGQELRDLAAPVEPVAGSSLKLTIDMRLQTAAKTALITEMKDWNRYLNMDKYSIGVVIAMNPKTGEILSLVSQPTFENNRMARQIPAYYYEQLIADEHRPLFNHAVSAAHPPGSVFKMATALGILNENVVTLDQKIEDPGKITITEKFSPNDPGHTRDYVCYIWKTTNAGHGLVDYLHGIALSCDVYFYKVGGGYQKEVPQGLGIWRIGEYARALGYGEVSGIELPGESAGLIPDPNWKRVTVGENWSTGDTYINTIGQGFVLATPIQVLESFATIANNGIHMQPTLIKEVLDAEGKVVKPFTPIQKWDITKDARITIYDDNNFPTTQKIIVQPWVIAKAKEGMRMVVTEGTASKFFIGDTTQSAGKTGTAEYCDNIAQEKNLCKPELWPAHAWYVGYAPYDDPEIVVVAFVYNGDEGSRVASPIVRKVLDAYFELKAIDQSNAGTTQP